MLFYSKMTLFETFASDCHRNDNRMLRSKFFVVCKCPGGQDTVKSVNCQMPSPQDSLCWKWLTSKYGTTVKCRCDVIIYTESMLVQ